MSINILRILKFFWAVYVQHIKKDASPNKSTTAKVKFEDDELEEISDTKPSDPS